MTVQGEAAFPTSLAVSTGLRFRPCQLYAFPIHDFLLCVSYSLQRDPCIGSVLTVLSDARLQSTKQAQLRSLMKQQQSSEGSSSPSIQKVDSPLAKYTAKGDLVCILCKLPVKTSAAWSAHCASATHKQNLDALLLKKRQQHSATPENAAPEDEAMEPSAKRAKFTEVTSEQVHVSEHPTGMDTSITHVASETQSPTTETSNEAVLRELRFVSSGTPFRRRKWFPFSPFCNLYELTHRLSLPCVSLGMNGTCRRPRS